MQQNGSYPGGNGNYQAPPPYPPYNQPAKTNGKSIVTLVLGILSLVVPYVGFLIGIVGIIFGALSFKELKKTGEQGRGLAIGGLITSILGTLLWGLIAIFLIVFLIIGFSEGSSYNNNFYY